MVPASGSYLPLLANSEYAHVRLAIAARPMSGVQVRHDLVDGLVSVLRGVGGDVADHYVRGLSSGECVPVVELGGPEKYWSPGELFLKS